jgi:hypothetical protein
MSGVQRFGKNRGGYLGETIDINAVMQEALAYARRDGWRIEQIPIEPEVELSMLHRPGQHAARRIYTSAGIHGDEPAGPLAVRQLLRENAWPHDAGLWLCPCLNPTGFALNRRENRHGQDLNRDYRHRESGEVRAHIAWLDRQPAFDLAICLHEDWEAQGFYLYELNPDSRPSAAQPMIDAVARVCPIDSSAEIEGRPAHGGIIYPSVDPNSRPQWPEAFYLLRNKTRQTYTLEAPSDFPLAVRVSGLVTAVRAAFQTIAP